MALFYFIGNVKVGKEREYADFAASKGSQRKNWKLYPHVQGNKILHVVEAANPQEIKEFLPDNLYELGEIIEIETVPNLMSEIRNKIKELGEKLNK